MSAGGVDLSGLAVPDAAAKLDAELAPRLAPDLLIGVPAAVGPKMADAKLKLDSTRTAKRALYARPASSPWRRDQPLDAAVAAFVAEIAKQVGKPARDAKIKSRCATSTASARGPGAASTSPRRPRRSTRRSTTPPPRACCTSR